MKILVTGGAGFIGTHLCRMLIKHGHDVIALDLVDPENAVTKVRYIRGDARKVSDLSNVISKIDAVYHFAATVSVQLCQENPSESYQHNLMATCEVLEAIRHENAKRYRPIRLIFSGSSVVYGSLGQKGRSLTEGNLASEPLSFYGAQKLASEHAIRLYSQNFKIPCVVFRFFNVYGIGQDPTSPYSGVISIFSNALKNKLPIRLNGGGLQTRDFVSVHDIARANVLALNLPEHRCDGSAINLGTGQEITIKDLALEMAKASGLQTEITSAPPRSGDVMHSLADISLAKKVLGWNPQYTLFQGLQELFQNGQTRKN